MMPASQSYENYRFYICVFVCVCLYMGLPWWLSGKESACNVGDIGIILGEGYGNLLQYSCLENPMNRRAWWATVHGVTRVGHDLATKSPLEIYIYIHIHIYTHIYI